MLRTPTAPFPIPSSVRATQTAIAASALIALAGCSAVGPDYRRPQIQTPSQFTGQPEAQVGPSTADLSRWWQDLGDPTLASLVERAIASNLDYKLALARLREARALRGVEESRRLPGVDASGTAERSRASENGGQPGIGSKEENFFRAGLDATWEIDIFGGVRRSVEGAVADVQAAELDRESVLVSLVADVAATYIELRTLQQRQEVSSGSIRTQEETVELTQNRLNAGIAAELEVAQAQAQLAQRRSQRPPLFAGERSAIYRLGVLLGQSPGALAEELEPTGPLPAGVEVTGGGLPSDLLRRRPDIRAAERRIAGATARIGAATADLYPRFSLNGGFGFSANELEPFFNMNSRTWNIGPSVRWNLFDAGRIRQLIEAASQREQQALITYQQTVLVAIEDVERAMARVRYERERNQFLREAVSANTRAVTLADERYRAGVGEFLNVLQSQAQLFDTQDALVASDAEIVQATVALYRALGGGWSVTPIAPDASDAGKTPTSDGGVPQPGTLAN